MADAEARAPAVRPGPTRVITIAALALVCAALPMFLLGALAPRIILDLEVDEVAIGTLVSIFFLAGAVTSLPGGHLTDRIGSSAALRTSAAIAAGVAVSIGLFGHELWILVMCFAVGGSAVAMADTGGARAISAGVPLRRQGLAFGGKEASIPIASMLAGLTVPILGVHLGWRPAYVVAAVLALAVIVLVPSGLDRGAARPASTGTRRPGSSSLEAPAGTPWSVDQEGEGLEEEAPVEERPVERGPVPGARVALVLLAIAAGLGGGAANSAPTFLVASTVASGVTESWAGVLLAVASAAGVTARLAAGMTADRRGGSERRLTAALMAVGGVGMVALAIGGPAVTVIGAVLALGGGWGWTGLAFFAAVRLLPERPAKAAGAILAGLASGGALGPLVFGTLAAGPGYGSAWSAGAAAMLVAAGLAVVADRSTRRHEPVGRP
jgi:MFS family permease